MPYASKAQSRLMHAKHPEIAARWDKEHPNQKGLPERKKRRFKTKKDVEDYARGLFKQ